jgi:hypothetical protein
MKNSTQESEAWTKKQIENIKNGRCLTGFIDLASSS